MISKKDIMGLVKKYAKSPEGKAQIKKVYGVEYDDKFSKKEAQKYVEYMRTILFDYIHPLIQSIAKNDILRAKIEVNEDGLYVAYISFDTESLHRESLEPDRFDGIENIILLFERGYHAGAQVHGTWHGQETHSLLYRAPNSFLQDAVDEFNSKYSNVATAKLEGEYQ